MSKLYVEMISKALTRDGMMFSCRSKKCLTFTSWKVCTR